MTVDQTRILVESLATTGLIAPTAVHDPSGADVSSSIPRVLISAVSNTHLPVLSSTGDCKEATHSTV
jgi:hypothetical protein